MKNFSPKKEDSIKKKIRRVFKNQGRKDKIDKLIRAWKRICNSERITLLELMALVAQVSQETPEDN